MERTKLTQETLKSISRDTGVNEEILQEMLEEDLSANRVRFFTLQKDKP